MRSPQYRLVGLDTRFRTRWRKIPVGSYIARPTKEERKKLGVNWTIEWWIPTPKKAGR